MSLTVWLGVNTLAYPEGDGHLWAIRQYQSDPVMTPHSHDMQALHRIMHTPP